MSLEIGKVNGIDADLVGDILLEFSTTNASNPSSMTGAIEFLFNNSTTFLFDATIQYVEEAIVNSMIAAETMRGQQN
ncbi:unnamed protein product [Rotaria sordida]|uniref:Uncharacterized protein n=1 Tax=Rotaria sordida TaxID=392033 RepID=A0A820KCQ1_9BILA|nr:unnamed protein product [Rotaria sordida]CAF3568181.1 unnamed protein product [Rotaria sordida]CAF4335172.1 unnamed protein product [Rotaria sordida]